VPDDWKGSAATVGKGYTIRVTPQGRVVEVRGAEEMAEKIVGELKDVDKRRRAWMEDWARISFSEDNVKQNFEGLLGNFPDRPVDVGDSWSRTTLMNHGFSRIDDTVLTFKERRGEVVVVDVAGKVRPNTNAKHLGPEMRVLSFRLSGEFQGTLELNAATGWPVRSKTTGEMSGTENIGRVLQFSGGTSRAMSLKSTAEIEWPDH
jgi:hypothetical protein